MSILWFIYNLNIYWFYINENIILILFSGFTVWHLCTVWPCFWKMSCSPRLHLFDQDYSENIIIGTYYYNLHCYNFFVLFEYIFYH